METQDEIKELLEDWGISPTRSNINKVSEIILKACLEAYEHGFEAGTKW